MIAQTVMGAALNGGMMVFGSHEMANATTRLGAIFGGTVSELQQETIIMLHQLDDQFLLAIRGASKEELEELARVFVSDPQRASELAAAHGRELLTQFRQGHYQNISELASDLYKSFGAEFKVHPDMLAKIEAQKVDLVQLRRLISSIGSDSAVDIAARGGNELVTLAHEYLRFGVPKKQIHNLVVNSQETGVIDDIRTLLTVPNDDPKQAALRAQELKSTVNKVASEMRNNPRHGGGDLVSIQEGARRVREGHVVRLGMEERDLTDETSKEWIEHKRIQTTRGAAFRDNILSADKQLGGKGGPKDPGTEYSKQIAISFSETAKGNPWNTADREPLLQELVRIKNRVKLARVVYVTNTRGRFVFHSDEFKK